MPKHAALITLPWPSSTGEDNRHVLVATVLRIMLRSLKTIHDLWRTKSVLTNIEVERYEQAIKSFTSCWHAFKWKPSVWVHWMICHSGVFVRKHRSMYFFSSIPTEHRHQHFKLDLRHSFQGWKLCNPSISQRGLRHVIELDAIDQRIRLLDASRDPTDGSRKKRRI